MKISTKGRYGIRALIDIALNSNKHKYVSIQDISKRQDISAGYLERIISKLKKIDVLHSERGAQGGYCLSKGADEIIMYDVLEVLEDSLDISDCVSKIQDCNCKNISECISRKLWKKLNDENIRILKNTTLEELIKGC